MSGAHRCGADWWVWGTFQKVPHRCGAPVCPLFVVYHNRTRCRASQDCMGMVQQNPLGSLFGSVGTNTVAGLDDSNTSLQSANSGNDLLQLAALLGGSQQQSDTFQPAQLLQVRQALAQQQATQVAAQQAEHRKESSHTLLHERRSL